MSADRSLRGPLRCLLLLCCLLLPTLAPAGETTLTLADGTEYPAWHFGKAQAPDRLLWLPPDGGFSEAQPRIARMLATLGHEVWLADPFEANFLPPVPSSLGHIDPQQTRALIERVLGDDPRPLFLLASGYGAIVLLQGLHAWQQAHPDDRRLRAVLLLSPKPYEAPPEPGAPARLLPIVRHSNARIWLMQPRKSPWFWKLEAIRAALAEGGSEVWLQILPGLRDRFHYRPDATEAEQQAAERLPAWLDEALRFLARLPAGARRPPPLESDSGSAAPRARKAHALEPWQGDPTPPPLDLPVLGDGRMRLDDLRGQVVLVNFWASWCPPCVHEMPSMEQLAGQLKGRPFRMIAVNMAEDPDTVRHFLEERVRFTQPVLLDRDGKALRDWKVFAFPTTYLLDHRGRIRYGVYGAVDWMAPEQRQVIERLLREAESAAGDGAQGP